MEVSNATVVLDNVIEKHIKKLWYQNLSSPLKVVSGNKMPQIEVVFRIGYSEEEDPILTTETWHVSRYIIMIIIV